MLVNEIDSMLLMAILDGVKKGQVEDTKCILDFGNLDVRLSTHESQVHGMRHAGRMIIIGGQDKPNELPRVVTLSTNESGVIADIDVAELRGFIGLGISAADFKNQVVSLSITDRDCWREYRIELIDLTDADGRDGNIYAFVRDLPRLSKWFPQAAIKQEACQ